MFIQIRLKVLNHPNCYSRYKFYNKVACRWKLHIFFYRDAFNHWTSQMDHMYIQSFSPATNFITRSLVSLKVTYFLLGSLPKNGPTFKNHAPGYWPISPDVISRKSWMRHTGGQFHCAFLYIIPCCALCSKVSILGDAALIHVNLTAHQHGERGIGRSKWYACKGSIQSVLKVTGGAPVTTL